MYGVDQCAYKVPKHRSPEWNEIHADSDSERTVTSRSSGRVVLVEVNLWLKFISTMFLKRPTHSPTCKPYLYRHR